MPQTKKHYHDLINNTKIKDGNEIHHPDGEIEVYLRLTPKKDKDDNAMTNNQLAKLLNNVVIEMRDGFAKIEIRLDKIETRLDVIEDKLERNNIN